MAERLEELDELDRLIHEPARLAIMTVLTACARADFLFLQRATGLTRGNLSSHLARLEAAGLVVITKRFVGRKPNTQVQLTRTGRAGVDRHWRQLHELRRGSVRIGARAAAGR